MLGIIHGRTPKATYFVIRVSFVSYPFMSKREHAVINKCEPSNCFMELYLSVYLYILPSLPSFVTSPSMKGFYTFASGNNLNIFGITVFKLFQPFAISNFFPVQNIFYKSNNFKKIGKHLVLHFHYQS